MIDEPFQLTNYSVKQSNKKFNVKGKSSTSLKNDLATLTVQSDGVHLLDIATQNTLQSFSTGPSTTFASPATTFIESQKDGLITRKTIALASCTSKKQKVLTWSESLSSSKAAHLGGPSKQEDFEIDASATSIHPIPVDPPTILIGYPDASYLYAQSDFTKKDKIKADNNLRQLSEFVFSPSDELSFLDKAEVERVVVLTVAQNTKDSSIKFAIYQVLNNAARAFEKIADATLPFEGTPVSITASSTGQLHILDKANTLHSIDIESVNDNHLIYKHLSSISFKKDLKDLTIMGLKGSLLLLAAKKDNQALLTVWDTTLKVLLSERSFEIPQSIGTGEIQMELSEATESSALLTMSNKSSKRAQAVVMSVSFNVPTHSTILTALGREAISEKYINAPAKQVQLKSTSPLDPDQNKLEETIKAIDQILSNSERTKATPEEPVEIIEDYLKSEKTRLRDIANELFRADLADAALETFGQDPDEKQETEDTSKTKNISTEPVIPSWYSRALIELVFKHALKETGNKDKKFEFKREHYNFTFLQYLLTKDIISNEYVLPWGGIVEALSYCSDVKTLPIAITHVQDIPETSLVFALKNYFIQQQKEKEINKMEVNGAVPKKRRGERNANHVENILRAIAVHKYTPGLLRRHLHEEFKDGEDVVRLFKQVEAWLQKEIDLPNDDISKFNTKGTYARSNISIEQLVGISQVLFDAFFPILLHYQKSHETIESIQESLKEINERELLLADLRRPLDTFKERVRVKKENALNKPRTRAERFEKRSLGVGIYTVEQFSLE